MCRYNSVLHARHLQIIKEPIYNMSHRIFITAAGIAHCKLNKLFTMKHISNSILALLCRTSMTLITISFNKVLWVTLGRCLVSPTLAVTCNFSLRPPVPVASEIKQRRNASEELMTVAHRR